ncbi:hypothetical protein [Croceibacterium selenioxidans]|uniref:hypothetical protein n=1 Tax=Croceibacterium selenioxidans TaxID=2838833 RepID=UPI002032CD2C|nr:hypothetical protein [Croceibacterium selenioxidans]
MGKRTRPALFTVLAGTMLAVLAAGPGPVSAQQGEAFRLDDRGGRRDRDRYLRANPSKVIATELAFARTAQEKGQWTAFAQFAADDAVMFVPQPVLAKEWLKKQQNPAQAVRWQPHQVWSSCDGSLAVTKGAWQRPDGSVGYFTTVWARQKNHEYKWVMDQGDVLQQPLEVPELIGASSADCGRVDPFAFPAAEGGSRREGRSKDNSLVWSATVDAAGARTVSVRMWQGGEMKEVFSGRVAAAS